MEKMKYELSLKLKELNSCIETHEQHERQYVELLGTEIIPDWVNEIIFNELQQGGSDILNGDIYMELPLELANQLEEFVCEEDLKELEVRLDGLIDFWKEILKCEKSRIENFKK